MRTGAVRTSAERTSAERTSAKANSRSEEKSVAVGVRADTRGDCVWMRRHVVWLSARRKDAVKPSQSARRPSQKPSQTPRPRCSHNARKPLATYWSSYVLEYWTTRLDYRKSTSGTVKRSMPITSSWSGCVS